MTDLTPAQREIVRKMRQGMELRVIVDGDVNIFAYLTEPPRREYRTPVVISDWEALCDCDVVHIVRRRRRGARHFYTYALTPTGRTIEI